MRIIALSTLKRFVDGLAGHRDQAAVKKALDLWYDAVSKADWSNASDVKRQFAAASIVSAERIVFNVKGNDYRLIVATDFERKIIFIKWLGNHAEYDKVNAREIDYARPKTDPN